MAGSAPRANTEKDCRQNNENESKEESPEAVLYTGLPGARIPDSAPRASPRVGAQFLTALPTPSHVYPPILSAELIVPEYRRARSSPHQRWGGFRAERRGEPLAELVSVKAAVPLVLALL